LAEKIFVATSNQWKSWCAARIICFNKDSKEIGPFQQARVRIPNIGLRCKKCFIWTPESEKKSDCQS